MRALALACLLLVAACAGEPTRTSWSVYGIVTDLDAPALDRVASFTLELDSGEELVFKVAPGDPDVTAADLREHYNFAFDLLVYFSRDESGDLVAERVEHYEE